MANTLGGLALSAIAQESLPVLQAQVPLLSAFSTDFSDGIAQEGSAISTRIPTAGTVTTYNAANGYVPADVTGTAVTCTLTGPHYHVAAFTDAEVGNITLPRLKECFINVSINAVINKVAGDMFALVTNANYSTAGYVGTTYSMANLITTPLAVLNAAGATSEKAAVLNATAFYGLLNDVKANYIIGDPSAIREGYIGNLAGAKVLMAPGLPNNSENLIGFVAAKESLAIATRVPFVLNSNGVVAVENLTDPKSGLTIQLRTWYSPDKGKTMIGAFVMSGVAKGNGSGLSRITSA